MMLGLAAAVSLRFRRRRMRRFAAEFALTSDTRVLDVGGTAANWGLLDIQPNLTLVNMPRAGEQAPPGVAWVFADGCRLPFADGSFDVVFSNSVIEHVGGPDRQQAFAREVARVGKRYFVQTPNYWFPVEHHLLTPLLHWLPRRWQTRLAWRWNLWQWIARPSEDRRQYYIRHYLEDIRLLDAAGMRGLFPGARLRKERFLGVTKSLIAAGGNFRSQRW
jgi:hypothetical protein